MTQRHPYIPRRDGKGCAICERKLEEHEFQFIPGENGEQGRTEKVK
jgi:hypothetical protein